MLTHFFNVEKNFRKKVFDSFCKISTRSQSLWRNFSKIRRYRREQADTNFIKKSLFQNFSSHLLFEKLQKILKIFDCLAPPYQKRMGNFCMRPLGHPAFPTPVSALKNDQKVDQHEANTVVKQAGWPNGRMQKLPMRTQPNNQNYDFIHFKRGKWKMYATISSISTNGNKIWEAPKTLGAKPPNNEYVLILMRRP